MSKESRPLESLNQEVKQLAEETKEASTGAADSYFDLLNKTILSFPTDGTEFGEIWKSYAEDVRRELSAGGL